MNEARTRDQGIEGLRAIAVLMVVIFHIGNDEALGGSRSFYAHLTYTFTLIHIPLFTAIAGFVHGLHPGRAAAEPARFIAGKAQRLLIPLVTVSSLQYIAELLAGSGAPLHEIWRIYVLPYSHFWYLQALFLVFVATTVLERLGLLATPGRWAVCMGAAILASALRTTNVVFSLSGSLYILPYFILGCGLGRFWRSGPGAAALTLAAVGAVLGQVFYQLAWYGVLEVDVSRSGALGFAVGLGTCTVLIALRAHSPFWLATLGASAYGIYLFQNIGAPLGRRVADFIGVTTPAIYFAFVLGSALAMGLAVHWLARRYRIADRLLLGAR